MAMENMDAYDNALCLGEAASWIPKKVSQKGLLQRDLDSCKEEGIRFKTCTLGSQGYQSEKLL